MAKLRNVSRRGVAVSVVALVAPMAALSGAPDAAAASGIAVVSPAQFPTVRVGTEVVLESVVVTNEGSGSVTVPLSAVTISGPDAGSFLVSTQISFTSSSSGSGGSTTTVTPSCYDATGTPTTVAPRGTCALGVAFLPTGFGVARATLTIAASDGSTAVTALSGTGVGGYYLAGAGGETAGFGDAPTGATDPRVKVMPLPIVGEAATIDGNGYWTASADGSVYPAGDAAAAGGVTARLNQPIVGIVADPSLTSLISSAPAAASSGIPAGYWLAAADGGVFAFGYARFHGSEGGTPLNKPIVGIAATPDGNGYWLVASDGGIFSFGDAVFHGSEGGTQLNRPIVGMASTPDGGGYWLVASDGGVFSFGDAAFYGSEGATKLTAPITGVTGTPYGNGYWLVASDGGVFGFGAAAFFGSLPGVAGRTWTAPDAIGLATTDQPLIAQLALSSGQKIFATRARIITNLNALRGHIRILPAQR